ncbi:flagellar biosynthesis protein FlhA [Pseudohongiella nitratireducens]|uniref:Flagellar biosynthesis protein FlhA n=1 Tax=Pseudohongiella nitratireducens TaxID=1768907 RepID=A0A917LPP0_9GAMM|nr:flagellar biosynthesis protein FlhA [Pseudohongiella nitratireducens]MDF1623608.1 flagellar biosynthesis protein FlhA [Pseudohongiella nitratireducens]GGG48533.1 flagellar biosynthesis protein FlhA [Pseudohongiella nitratireducens]
MSAGNSLNRQEVLAGARNLAQGNLGIPVLLLVILAMMTLPLPPFLLDVLFTFNITIALVVLCVAVYAMRPLDFAVFPTILLVSTLLRLALNVASTRVVLLSGHEGGAAAGRVIESFGEVVIGGNYAVGLIVFLILIIINFVVVTKGAGRIAEVSARFTLDAMPGKQMAVDADLNAGLIDQEQARTRRLDITQEADFYGAMDGASKFVKGDAIAGILILVINIAGGLAIGMLQHGLDFSTAAERYALLTIGDGLVAQIPALVLSTSAAIMVTRNNSSEMMGTQVLGQMFATPRSLGVAAGILFVMGIVPGMPHFAFLALAFAAASGAGAIYWQQRKKLEAPAEEAAENDNKAPADAEGQEAAELGWNDVSPVDIVGLEVGYRLIPLVDKSQGGPLLARIKGVRKKLSQELGFLVPSVHIRDNLDLQPNAYRINLMGVNIGGAEIYPEREMAINPGQVYGKAQGIEAKDPAFGLDAVWIEPEQREQVQTLGYTVVDASTVVATHMNSVLQQHAHELLGHDEVHELLNMLSKSSEKLAEELPSLINLNQLRRVLQNLLQEGIPVKDMRTIGESLAVAAGRTSDPVALTSAVRVALSRVIVQGIFGDNTQMPVMTLESSLEQILLKAVQQSAQQNDGMIDDSVVIEPGIAEKLQQSLVQAAQRQELAGNPAVLLVSAALRPLLSRFVRYTVSGVKVLSFQEIPDNKQITIVATIGQ